MEKPRTASNETMKSGLDHATDVWLDEGSEPPRKAPRKPPNMHTDRSTQTAWTCPTFRPGDLVGKSMPKTYPDGIAVFRVLSVEVDGRVIVECAGVYLGETVEADPHHFRHLTDDELRTRATHLAACGAVAPAAAIEEELKLAAEREVQALHKLDESGIV